MPSSDNVYVAREFCLRNNLRCTPCPDTLPNVIGIVKGEETAIYGLVTVTFKIGSLVETLRCAVIDLPTPIDVLMTDDWLHKHKASLDYHAHCIVLQKRARQHIIRCIAPKKTAMPAHQPVVLLTAQQCKRRLVKHRAVYYLVTVQTADAEAAVTEVPTPAPAPLPADIAKLVSQYPDVFADQPPYGGSNIQLADEVIPLLPGTKPIFRPMFRYSPMDLEEMERQVKESVGTRIH